MPRESGALSSADVMKRVLFAAWAVWLGGVLGLSAQDPTPTPTPPPTPTPTPGLPTTIPAGVRYATESSANVNGVRVQLMPDGSVWFLEASADRVGVLRGTDITYWQLRPDDEVPRRLPRAVQPQVVAQRDGAAEAAGGRDGRSGLRDPRGVGARHAPAQHRAHPQPRPYDYALVRAD